MNDQLFQNPKDEYICTDISQRQLAKKWDMSEQVIARQSINEKWVKARKQFNSKRLAKIEDKIATTQAEWIARHVRLSKLMQDKATVGIESKMPKMLKTGVLIEMAKQGTEIERKVMTLGREDEDNKVQVNIFLPEIGEASPELPVIDVTPESENENA